MAARARLLAGRGAAQRKAARRNNGEVDSAGVVDLQLSDWSIVDLLDMDCWVADGHDSAGGDALRNLRRAPPPREVVQRDRRAEVFAPRTYMCGAQSENKVGCASEYQREELYAHIHGRDTSTAEMRMLVLWTLDDIVVIHNIRAGGHVC